MNVVIGGSRERASEKDKEAVFTLLDQLRVKFPGLMVLSAACDKGIGCFVKDKCLQERDKFQFAEFSVRVFADLPRSRMNKLFFSRNTALLEEGDEFHIFVDNDRRGAMEDVVEKAIKMNRPVYQYLPNGMIVTGAPQIDPTKASQA